MYSAKRKSENLHRLRCRYIEETIDRLEVPPEGSKPLHFDSQFAQSKLVQFRELLRRNFISYSRNSAYNGTRYGFPRALQGFDGSAPILCDLLGACAALILTLLSNAMQSVVCILLLLQSP